MNVSQILEKVNRAIKEPISEQEIFGAMVLLHNKLCEPKWAIEDEALRDEMEKLLVQMTVKSYMNDRLANLDELHNKA